MVFSGVVFGILAFAGMESPLYLSEDTRKRSSTVPRAMIFSYAITGILLIVSAFSIMAYLGKAGLAAYTSNPFYVNSSIRSSFGMAAYTMFAILAILSSMNLCVAYSNAVLNEIRRTRTMTARIDSLVGLLGPTSAINENTQVTPKIKVEITATEKVLALLIPFESFINENPPMI